MMKFKLENKQYTIPDFISIENYVKIYKVKDLFSDDYFSAKLISILTECKLEDLLKSDFQNVNYITNYVLNQLPNEPKFIDRFELDGVNYGFFPNWKDLTFAEFMDLDTISGKKPDELLDMLHILAAIMFRPIVSEKSKHNYQIEKYDVASMKERAELFKKKLDVKYILGGQFFFIKYAKRYYDYIQLSSMKKLSLWTKIKILWTMRKVIWTIVFKKDSDGSWSSTELLEMILQSTNLSTKKM